MSRSLVVSYDTTGQLFPAPWNNPAPIAFGVCAPSLPHSPGAPIAPRTKPLPEAARGFFLGARRASDARCAREFLSLAIPREPKPREAEQHHGPGRRLRDDVSNAWAKYKLVFAGVRKIRGNGYHRSIYPD